MNLDIEAIAARAGKIATDHADSMYCKKERTRDWINAYQNEFQRQCYIMSKPTNN